MRRLLTDAEIAYLKEIAPGRYVVEITKMLNEKFGKNPKESPSTSSKALGSILKSNKIGQTLFKH